jgi:prophage regulatory protein
MQNLRLLKRRQVEAKVGLERSSIYDRLARGEFPKPVNLGPKSVRWIESDVDKWIAARIAERDSKNGGA